VGHREDWIDISRGKVTAAKLDSLSLAEAKQEYSDVAGIDAASELAKLHATCNAHNLQ